MAKEPEEFSATLYGASVEPFFSRTDLRAKTGRGSFKSCQGTPRWISGHAPLLSGGGARALDGQGIFHSAPHGPAQRSPPVPPPARDWPAGRPPPPPLRCMNGAGRWARPLAPRLRLSCPRLQPPLGGGGKSGRRK